MDTLSSSSLLLQRRSVVLVGDTQFGLEKSSLRVKVVPVDVTAFEARLGAGHHLERLAAMEYSPVVETVDDVCHQTIKSNYKTTLHAECRGYISVVT